MLASRDHATACAACIRDLAVKRDRAEAVAEAVLAAIIPTHRGVVGATYRRLTRRRAARRLRERPNRGLERVAGTHRRGEQLNDQRVEAAVGARLRRAKRHQRRSGAAKVGDRRGRVVLGVPLPDRLADGVRDEMAVVDEAEVHEPPREADGCADRRTVCASR